MDKNFSIAIDKPCSQNFKDFMPTEQGGYCSMCSKDVIDFTKYTDSELINYFKSDKEKVCGLLLSKQLKQYSECNSKKHSKTKNTFYKSIFGFSIISLFTINNGFGQTQKKETVEYDANSKTGETANKTLTQRFTVGYVYDESGPISGANVSLKNSDLRVSTGFDGKFSFNTKLNIGDVLVVSFMGFQTKEYVISSETVKINLKSYNERIITMGEVAVKKVYKSKTTFWQKIKNIFND